jgi:hypothetical protein
MSRLTASTALRSLPVVAKRAQARQRLAILGAVRGLLAGDDVVGVAHREAPWTDGPLPRSCRFAVLWLGRTTQETAIQALAEKASGPSDLVRWLSAKEVQARLDEALVDLRGALPDRAAGSLSRPAPARVAQTDRLPWPHAIRTGLCARRDPCNARPEG